MHSSIYQRARNSMQNSTVDDNVTPQTTRLEQLPNEILLQVFKHTDTRDLFHGFWKLNERFTQLVQSIRYRSLTIETDESQLVATLGFCVHKLVVETCLNIDFVRLPNLQSLILYDITENHLRQIRSKLMPSLTYLAIPCSNRSWHVERLILKIFTDELLSLTNVNLRFSFEWDITYYKSSSLRSMIASDLSPCHVLQILAMCPHLSHLRVCFEKNAFSMFYLDPPLRNHPLKSFTLADPYSQLTSYDINTFLQHMPNVEDVRLTFSCDCPFMDCLRMVMKHLPDLRRFACRVDMTTEEDMSSIETIQQLHPCFSDIQYETDDCGYRTYVTQTKADLQSRLAT